MKKEKEIVEKVRKFAEFCSANGYTDRELIRHIAVELLRKNGLSTKEAVKLAKEV